MGLPDIFSNNLFGKDFVIRKIKEAPMRLGGAHLDGIVQFGYIALYLQNIACPGLFVHCIAAGGGCLIVFWDRPIRLHSLSHR